MRKGFTLIELMIVIAIIAIIAAIAIPNLLESRISSNEAGAATSLKSGVLPAQVAFQAGGYVDIGSTTGPTSPNGIGDFATELQHMAGISDATAGNAIPDVALSMLPQTWNGTDGSILINGYLFDNDSLFELNFCATAWPQDEADSIGRRRFAINAGGQVYATAPAATNAAVDPSSPFSASFNTPQSATWSPWRR